MTTNKLALVSGGNRGIGLAIVKGLASQGIEVLLGCRDLTVGASLAKEITAQTNCEVQAVQLDLSTRQTMEQDMAAIDTRFPNIDILINNAAILDEANFAQMDYDNLSNTMHVNAYAPFTLAQFFGTKMAQRGYGRIVNLSSGWGTNSGLLDSPPLYGISKYTLNAMTQVLAHNLQGDVKVNAMCPGWVRTEMGGPGADRSPEEGAETAIYLATLDSDSPTGKIFRDKQQIDW